MEIRPYEVKLQTKVLPIISYFCLNKNMAIDQYIRILQERAPREDTLYNTIRLHMIRCETLVLRIYGIYELIIRPYKLISING